MNQLKEILDMRSNEKQEMQELNDRFASFIERVRLVEQENSSLQVKLVQYKGKHQQAPNRASKLCEREIRKLRKEKDQVSKERDEVQVQRDSVFNMLTLHKERLQEETQKRHDAENKLADFQKAVDDATLTRLKLERKIESLTDEIEFLKKLHDEKIQDMLSIETQQIKTEVDAAGGPDLTAALREIRSQYDSIATKNRQEWFQSKSEFSKHDVDATGKEETSELKRQIKDLKREMNALKSTNEAQLKQIKEMEDQLAAEIQDYKENISQLKEVNNSLKTEMSICIKDYDDLLNVKMALDMEIAAYRLLLEKEESRIRSPNHESSSEEESEEETDEEEDLPSHTLSPEPIQHNRSAIEQDT